jgi:acetyl esterase/lipase
VRSGHCILGYHHWQIPNTKESGVYQDVAGALKGASYTFGIYVSVDKAKKPTRDAVSIELRLESTVDGHQQSVASKFYKVADLPAEDWQKLTVSGVPVSDKLRVLVVITPSPMDGTRGGALRFDDAFLGLTGGTLPSSSPPSSSSGTDDSSPFGSAIVKKDIPYVANPHPRQTLDLYLPKDNAQGPATLVVWIHGGAWMLSNKDWNNVKYLVKHGYALASVDYRLSGDATFPAQIKDCNTALNFLLASAASYGIDPKRFVVGGASAGGQLALLLGLARNERAFGADPSVKPFAILDFFGPTDLTSIIDEVGQGHGREVQEDVVPRLLGGPLIDHLELARQASPLSYVGRENSPVLILHGDQDDLVPYAQSQSLHSLLDQAGVKNQLITVKGAGHDGPMFETPEIQEKVISFLRESARGGK